MKQYKVILFICISLITVLQSCRDDDMVFLSEAEQVTPPNNTSEFAGFYLLNEGNMGMNLATLDYFEFPTGVYYRDIYSEKNPNVVKELGDVGNDLKRYGNKLYAVINSSNKIEVMNAYTAKRITDISVPNGRYLAFDKGKAYISSYAGKVGVDEGKGFVAEIDTTTLELTRKVTVGYQPEEIVVHNNKLYVANSGGYRAPNYDNTVSVIDLNSFEVIKTIEVDVNLHRMKVDSKGDIYVSSRGNYGDIPSRLYVIDSNTDKIKTKLDIPISDMYVCGDSLYYYSALWDGSDAVYGILNTNTKKVVTTNFITDGTDKDIVIPYGLAVDPETRDIYVTDAQNYVVSGYIYCFSHDGKKKWKTMAGNIPAHITFVPKK